MSQEILDKIKTNLEIFANNLNTGGIIPEKPQGQSNSTKDEKIKFYKVVMSMYWLVIIFIAIRYILIPFVTYGKYRLNSSYKKNKEMDMFIFNYILGSSSINDPNHDIDEKLFSLVLPIVLIYYNALIIQKCSTLIKLEEVSNDVCENGYNDLIKLIAGNILLVIFLFMLSYLPYNDQLDDGTSSMFFFWFILTLFSVIGSSSVLLCFGFINETISSDYCKLFYPQ